MKTFLATLILFFTPICCWAAPFLVCNDSGITNVTSYTIDINGTEYSTPFPMHMDVEFLSIGDHIAKAKPVNMWGEGNWTGPLDFTKELPGDLSGFGLSAD